MLYYMSYRATTVHLETTQPLTLLSGPEAHVTAVSAMVARLVRCWVVTAQALKARRHLRRLERAQEMASVASSVTKKDADRYETGGKKILDRRIYLNRMESTRKFM